ncbi:MAG: 1-acyl-sn-glycerol-3-phosphate acyltransferase [Myxococcales bacterium]|nr:1-acyl-sn-glycerol-3-phosphate acyltransferase [Myxococcales bacterium]
MRDYLVGGLATARTSFGLVADAVTGRSSIERMDRRLKAWSRRLLDIADLKLDVSGLEQVDWSRQYVIMSNHQSHLDIPVLFHVVPSTMRMIAKQELFRIPILGKAMLVSGFIPIDRKNRKRAMASIELAKERIRSGISIWISPEGTRTLDGHLLPLKKGGFVLARDTQTPILPLVLDGTFAALPPSSGSIRRGTTVRVVIGQPIPVEGVPVNQVMEQVRSFFAAELGDRA